MTLPILAATLFVLAPAQGTSTVPAAAKGPEARPQVLTIVVTGPDGLPATVSHPVTRARFVLPFTTLADTVQRAGLDRGAFTMEFTAAPGRPPTLEALVHSRDEVAVDTPGGPRVFGKLRLPVSVTESGEDANDYLGHLARLDGLCPPAGSKLMLRGPGGKEELVCFLAPSAGARQGAFAVTAGQLNGLNALSAVAAPETIDAALYGTPSPPFRRAAIPLTPDHTGLRYTCTLPQQLLESGEGQSITLIIESGGIGASVPAPMVTAKGGPLVPLNPFTGYVHLEGPAEQLDIRPTMGPGAAWGDVNEDGFLDLFVPQGGGREGSSALRDRLWLGAADGSFTDATAGAGLGAGDAGMGALFADLNGDGHLDLYAANYGQDRLFLGGGDATFEDATGLLPELGLWSASVIAGDPDRDGDLDLYVTSYLDYDPAKMPPVGDLDRYQREDPIEMLPFAFPGARNVFLENQLAETGTLGFKDTTEALGLLDASGRGMQATFWDFDGDGDEDLYIANDVSPNVLFRNDGDGAFKDVSFATGLDDPRGGMGLAIGDVDEDGDDDVFLTNWQLEANALYLNALVSHQGRKRRRAAFHDSTVKSGLGPSGIGKTSWGAELFDLDLDGHLDLYVANGYTSPDYESTGICVGQTDLLFLGDGRGRFRPANDLAPAAMSISLASRGAIGADYDRDGDVDLLVTSNNGPLVLLQNRAERAGRWIGIRLRDAGSMNRFAIGARVEITTKDGAVRIGTVRAGHGYLTAGAPELHFGVGTVKGEATVQVRWPNGKTTSAPLALDQWHTIEAD